MDVQGDVVLVASYFGRENAVYRDVVFPMSFSIHVNLPESELNSKFSPYFFYDI